MIYTTACDQAADTLGMPENPKEEIKEVQQEIGELVKRALIQAGDLQDIEEKLKGIVERSSKMTPPPEPTDV